MSWPILASHLPHLCWVTPPDEAGALPPEHLHELLLAEALHLKMPLPWQEKQNQGIKQ